MQEKPLNALKVIMSVLEESRFKDKYISEDHWNKQFLKLFPPMFLL